jgi:hypothetical protein
VNAGGTFYLVSSGVRHGITDPGMLASYGLGFGDATAATPGDLALPEGNLLTPNDGSLVKSREDPTVYLVSDQHRYAFVSARVFTALGFRFASVLVVTNPELQALPASANLSDPAAAHLDGADVSSGGTVYWVSGGTRYPYPSPDTYNSWHIKNDFSTVVPANAADLALPVGGPVAARVLN